MSKIASFAIAAGIAAGVFAAEALKPDPATIPKPGATSVFYFVAPTERTGSRIVLTAMPGLTTGPASRVYEKMFEKGLTSYRQGLIMIVR